MRIFLSSLLLNSSAPGKFKWILKIISLIHGWGISCEISLRWISPDLIGNNSALVQVMTWCQQTTNYNLSQCWPSFLSPYGITRPHWLNSPLGNTSDIIFYVKKECYHSLRGLNVPLPTYCCITCRHSYIWLGIIEPLIFHIYDALNSGLWLINGFKKNHIFARFQFVQLEYQTHWACVIFHDNLTVLTGAKICVNMRAKNWITVKCHYSIQTWILNEMGTVHVIAEIL